MKSIKILLGAALLALAGSAFAIPSGNVIFDGKVTTDTNDVLTATTFTFVDVDTEGDGSFGPLTNQAVSFSNLVVPTAGNLSPFAAIAPLWTATVSAVLYKFDLETLTTNAVSSGSRIINGTGTVTVGTETAFGSWKFSTQSGGVGGRFSFSASTVPAPGVVLLLGAGLIGIGAARRARKGNGTAIAA